MTIPSLEPIPPTTIEATAIVLSVEDKNCIDVEAGIPVITVLEIEPAADDVPIVVPVSVETTTTSATPTTAAAAMPCVNNNNNNNATTTPETVRVVSPIDAPEGTPIHLSVDGIEFWARAPPGGVRSGKPFWTPYPHMVRVHGQPFVAIAPPGGCRHGDVVETLHPSMAPPLPPLDDDDDSLPTTMSRNQQQCIAKVLIVGSVLLFSLSCWAAVLVPIVWDFHEKVL